MLPLALAAMFALPVQLEADRDWQEGTRLFEEFRYDAALGHLENALARDGRSDEERARILMLIGLIHAKLLREAAAVSSFERALLADETVTLGEDASPRIVPLFERARERVAARQTATTTTVPLPADDPVPPPAAKGPPPDENGLAPIAWTTLVTGGAVTVLGAATWGSGVALFAFADGQRFQGDVHEWGERAAYVQIGGMIGLGAGLIALSAGAVLLAVSAAEGAEEPGP